MNKIITISPINKINLLKIKTSSVSGMILPPIIIIERVVINGLKPANKNTDR
jgi:hypothetical protein